MTTVRFDQRYREHVTLRDGSRATLRLVTPDDKALLRRGFDRLSTESRYRRFLSAKTQLSDAELVYLTEVDGHDHFGIGAVAKDAEGHDEGVAIARFIRSNDDPRAAEAAIAVIDDWQHRGLGTLLLLRLVAAARERGVEHFTGEALLSNVALRDVLAQLPAGLHTRSAGDEIFVEVELPDVPSDAAPGVEYRDSPVARVFALMAQGLVVVRRAFERLATRGGDRAPPS